MTPFDLIVLGAGPGGYETAATAAAMGQNVLLVERDELGGTCLNRGCIPTKALLKSAEVADVIRDASAFGVNVGACSLDYAAAVGRKDAVVAALREGVAQVLSGVEVVHGEARFVAPRVVEVGGREYTALKIIVATGSRPASLPIPGAELTVSSDFMLSARELPQSITIIGGGVIGMEFASMLRSFGAEVTVLEYCREILPGFDDEIAKRLRMSMKRRGINVVTSAEVTAVCEGADGMSRITHYTVKGKEKTLGSSMVLMAVGRKAVLPSGLEAQGIELKKGFIATNGDMSTNIPGVYAVGDVNGRCMLAHAATAQGRRALGLDVNLEVIPSAVFTNPECAMVGLTQQQAVERDIDVAVGVSTYRANGKAVASDCPDGLAKIVVDSASGAILGAHIVGAHASDLIQELAVAISAGLTNRDIATTVHPHPTLSEIIAVAVSKTLV